MSERLGSPETSLSPEELLRDAGIRLAWLAHVPSEDRALIEHYLAETPEGGSDTTRAFFQEYGILGLQSVVAVMRTDPSLVEDVVRYAVSQSELGDSLSSETVLSHMIALDAHTHELKELFRQLDADEAVAAEGLERYRERIARFAKDLLRKGVLGNSVESYARIGRAISAVEVGPAVLTSLAKTLHQHGALNVEMLAESELHMVEGGNFKGVFRDMASKMQSLQEKNYGTEGHDYQNKYPVLYAALRSSLTERIESSENPSRFYLFLHRDDMVGFFRFDDVRDASGRLVRKHLASVLGNPKYRGGSMVEAALARVLGRERDVPVFAEVDPDSPIYKKYVAMGFEVKGEHDAMGLRVLDIELPAKDPELRGSSK